MQLALNPWLSPITMNIDNEGPGVFITNQSNLPGPLTSGDVIMLEAEIVEYESGFDDYRLTRDSYDIFKLMRNR